MKCTNKRKIALLIIICYVVGAIIYIIPRGEASTIDSISQIAIGKGKVAEFNFDTGVIKNEINGKTYSLYNNASGGVGGSYVTTPYGKGIQFSGGYVEIPSADIGVATADTVTVSYWFKWSGEEYKIPIILGGNARLYSISNTLFGFNTMNGDVYGINNPFNTNNYINVVAVFNKNNATTNSLYVNGIKQAVSQKYGTTDTNPGTFTGLGLSFSQDLYSLNGSVMDEVNVWNRALSDVEISSLYSSYIYKGASLTLNFNNGNAQDLLTNKVYGMTGNSGNSFVDTPYGKGIKFGLGAAFSSTSINLINSDLGINATNTEAITTSFYTYIPSNTPETALGPVFMNNSIYSLYYQPVGNFLGFCSAVDSVYGTSIPVNQYIHVVTVMQKNDMANSKIYINGASKPLGYQANINRAPYDNSNAKFEVNMTFAGNNNTVSDVQVWNRSLNDKEVSDLYNNTNQRFLKAEMALEKSEVSSVQANLNTTRSSIVALESSDFKRALSARLNTVIKPVVTLSKTVGADNIGLGFSINDSSQKYSYKLYKKRTGENNFIGMGDFPQAGLTGKFNFDAGNAYNAVNNKSYNIGTNPTGGSGGSVVTTPYGKGIQFTGGQLTIPTADLGISDASTDTVTVSMWFKNNDLNRPVMPISFPRYNIYCSVTDGYMGFNTGNNDVWGASTNMSDYVHMVVRFKKNNSKNSAIYTNGNKLDLSRSYSTKNPDETASVFGDTLYISGFRNSTDYNLKNSIVTGVQVWNRALSETEVENVYRFAIGVDTPSATLVTDKTFTGVVGDYMHLGKANLDYSKGFNINMDVRWDKFHYYSRVLSMGPNPYVNNIIVSNVNIGSNVFLATFNNATETDLIYPNAVSTGSTNNISMRLDSTGKTTMYKNGVTAVSTGLALPTNISRDIYTGWCTSSEVGFFAGRLQNLEIETYVTSYKDYMIKSSQAPGAPTISYSHQGHKANLTFSSAKNLDVLSYYVVATGEDGSTFTSNTVTQNSIGEISGYSYSIDNVATGNESALRTINSTGSFSQILSTGLYYLHVRTQNANGLWGSITDYTIDMYSTGGEPTPKITPTTTGNTNIGIGLSNTDSTQTYNYNVYKRKAVLPDGVTGILDFTGDKITNKVDGKIYALGTAPDGSIGGSYVDTPYGRGIKFTNGQIKIPTADLEISDSKPTDVSFSFRIKYNKESAIMPIGFNMFDLLMGVDSIGINTGNSDNFGIVRSTGEYDNITVVFKYNSVSASGIYINGIKQNLTQLKGTPVDSRAVFGTHLNISGFGAGIDYRMNGSIMTDIKIWNRALTDTEAKSIYDNHTGSFTSIGNYTSGFTDTTSIDTAGPQPVKVNNVSTDSSLSTKITTNISWLPSKDIPTLYNYYTVARGSADGYDYTSSKNTGIVTSGLKEYWYVVDSNGATEPTGTLKTTATTIAIDNLSPGTKYLHIKAVDNAGNVSSTTHYPFTVEPIVKLNMSKTAVSFNNVNSLQPTYTLPNAITATIYTNGDCDLYLNTGDLTGIVGNKISGSYISAKLSTDSTYVSLMPGVATKINTTRFAGGGVRTVNIDLKLTTNWHMASDSYTAAVIFTAKQ